MFPKAFAHNTRVNDALNAKLFADESGQVIRGQTTVRSKDGLPLNLYAPAEGAREGEEEEGEEEASCCRFVALQVCI